jgi:hypothetical protein
MRKPVVVNAEDLPDTGVEWDSFEWSWENQPKTVSAPCAQLCPKCGRFSSVIGEGGGGEFRRPWYVVTDCRWCGVWKRVSYWNELVGDVLVWVAEL